MYRISVVSCVKYFTICKYLFLLFCLSVLIGCTEYMPDFSFLFVTSQFLWFILKNFCNAMHFLSCICECGQTTQHSSTQPIRATICCLLQFSRKCSQFETQKKKVYKLNAHKNKENLQLPIQDAFNTIYI